MLEVITKKTGATAPIVPQEKISFEDFLVKYDGKFAEWIDGEVDLTMTASDRHQDLVRFLTIIIGVFVEEKDLGIIRTAPLVMRLSKTKRGREPDLFFETRRLKPCTFSARFSVISAKIYSRIAKGER